MHRKKHMWKMRLVAAGLVAILGISCFQSASASALSKAKNKKSEAQTALDNANADIENIQRFTEGKDWLERAQREKAAH